jgi:hypothetical protein
MPAGLLKIGRGVGAECGFTGEGATDALDALFLDEEAGGGGGAGGEQGRRKRRQAEEGRQAGRGGAARMTSGRTGVHRTFPQ